MDEEIKACCNGCARFTEFPSGTNGFGSCSALPPVNCVQRIRKTAAGDQVYEYKSIYPVVNGNSPICIYATPRI